MIFTVITLKLTLNRFTALFLRIGGGISYFYHFVDFKEIITFLNFGAFCGTLI